MSHRSSDKKHSKSDSGLEVAGYETSAMMTGARHDEDLGPRQVTTIERRRSSAGTSSKSNKYDSKGRSKSKTTRSDESTYYGVPAAPRPIPTHLVQPIPHRPAIITAQSYPSRPQSYHAPIAGAGYGPPISHAGFWQNQAAYYPSPHVPPPSFIQNAPSSQEYLPSPVAASPRSLRNRFGEPARTGSGFGFRNPIIQQRPQDEYEDEYASASEASLPRTSMRYPSNREVTRPRPKTDAELMPPPERPTSARPGRRGILRPSTVYPPEVLAAPPAEEDRNYERHREWTRRGSSVHRSPVADEFDKRRIETANNGRRRQSYYEQSASIGSGGSAGSRWENKAAQAASYQAEISGSALPLTDALLRQQRRQGGSSRSTKSSGSRDESDYRQSATTRTTRSVSSPEDENVTIKVTGNARVTVSGAQIDCNDSSEIEITRQKSLRGSESVRGGSELSNSEYGGHLRHPNERLSSAEWSRAEGPRVEWSWPEGPRADSTRVDKPAGQSRRRSVSYTRQSPGGYF